MDHRELAERAKDAHGAVLAARTGKREMLARQVALQDRRAPVADRLAPGGAVTADAAVRNEGADDVVTGLHPCHARPHLLDDPGALVAKDHRQACLEVPVRDVDVGVAQARVQVADQNLAVLRPVQVELLDLDALTRLVDDGCLGLHRLSFGWLTPLTLPPRPPHVQARVFGTQAARHVILAIMPPFALLAAGPTGIATAANARALGSTGIAAARVR